LCEVIIEYCVKLEYDAQGTPILTTVYDRHYYPNILCGLKVPQNYYFWNKINEAILNDLYSKQTIWPLCTAGKYAIVKTVFDHCIKYINDPVNGILKTELCMDKPMTCRKTYHVCLIQREPPIFRTDLILIESNSNCPVFLPYYPWGDGTVNPPHQMNLGELIAIHHLFAGVNVLKIWINIAIFNLSILKFLKKMGFK